MPSILKYYFLYRLTYNNYSLYAVRITCPLAPNNYLCYVGCNYSKAHSIAPTYYQYLMELAILVLTITTLAVLLFDSGASAVTMF